MSHLIRSLLPLSSRVNVIFQSNEQKVEEEYFEKSKTTKYSTEKIIGIKNLFLQINNRCNGGRVKNTIYYFHICTDLN